MNYRLKLSRKERKINRYEVLNRAKSYVGTPYKYGGNTRSGIDCSGLVCQGFSSVGIKLPRVTYNQAKVGKKVSLKRSKIGDLVFFKTTKNNRKKVNHVGIISKVEGKHSIFFIHSSTSKGVREDNIFSPYWRSRYKFSRRIF